MLFYPELLPADRKSLRFFKIIFIGMWVTYGTCDELSQELHYHENVRDGTIN
jgi:hypothetical protein